MDMDLQQETSQVQVVSKQVVILSTTNDWKPWYQLKKDQAKRLKIWEFVDPEGTKKFEEEVVEPTEPQLIDYVKERPLQEGEVPQRSHLTEKERQLWREDRAGWKDDYARWATRQKHYEGFAYGILTTIGRTHLHLLSTEEDPRRRLQILQARFSLGTWANQEAMRQRYKSLHERPKAANLDSWFDDWIQIAVLGEEADLPEFKDLTP
ncbi:hypothetical protein EJ04DRAFT_554015 [Polyplosphaeria fusca]|uniref:Uncharacterized protein n=1 Tax=Polyplosphaeria fusca TaxID=682080 RepID=A0A9P4V0S6_9PLEO|nr:hypothetical protein EJ04DRAFT_554015 [Polyplosphaeria fusca]